MNSNDVVIVSAYRTPIGSFNGALSFLKASDLGSIVLKHMIAETKVVPDDVIIGQALTAGQGQNPARQTVVNAGLPNQVPATTVNMLCGSGLKAVALGFQSIRSGDAKLVVCGGQESMSLAPHCVHLRKGYKMGDATMVDTMAFDGLTDAFNNVLMGKTAENVAKTFGVSRERQDEFSLASQHKYQAAKKNNSFQNEIVPVKIADRSGEKVIDTDEGPRADSSIESLKKLKPCFIPLAEGGTVTAGNASSINDGAALLMLASAEAAKSNNLTPLVRIVSWAQCGNEPMLMGVAPIQAIKLAVEKAGWSLKDVDIFEINEAFASQSIVILDELQIDKSKVNVNGGSIAIGHPIGCSGARVLVTLIHSMLKDASRKRGLASLCIGGGMSVAMCVERV